MMSDPEATATEFAQREQEVAVSLIVDLIERMERAQKTITEMAEIEINDLEATRLFGKANGVALCLSYAREALRT